MGSRVPGVVVVACPPACAARDDDTGLRRLGSQPGVDQSVERSLPQSGSRIRCFAYSSRTDDRTRPWSHRFDLDHDGDLFRLEDAMADPVGQAVASLQPPREADPSRPSYVAKRGAWRSAIDRSPLAGDDMRASRRGSHSPTRPGDHRLRADRRVGESGWLS